MPPPIWYSAWSANIVESACTAVLAKVASRGGHHQPAKHQHRTWDGRPTDAGNVWTRTAVDADTKLILSWDVGARDVAAAQHFIGGLAGQLANWVQLTSDGHNSYLEVVEQSVGADIDYAMPETVYGDAPGEGRCSPDACIGTLQRRVEDNPNPALISASYVERANLSTGMRCWMRWMRGPRSAIS